MAVDVDVGVAAVVWMGAGMQVLLIVWTVVDGAGIEVDGSGGGTEVGGTAIVVAVVDSVMAEGCDIEVGICWSSGMVA